MLLSRLIKELEHIKETSGDIQVALHDDKPPENDPESAPTVHENFHVVMEDYGDEGNRVRISSWPY